MAEHTPDTIQWNVVTHEHKEHTTDWYWALGLLVVVGSAVSIWVGNFLFALVLVVGGGSIGFLAMRGPREHMVGMGKRGITIDGTLYRWDTVRSFWVEYDTDYPHLLLAMTGMLAPHILLPLDSVEQARTVEAHLKQYATEEEQAPHIGEYFTQLLGL
jgi:hypothetical protein